MRLTGAIRPLSRLPCCPFSSTRTLTRDTVATTFRKVDYDFARSTPLKRAHVRLPIIINGAGPAGLILAIGLQNAKIPFEICEAHRHDLPSKPRRNHASLLSMSILSHLKRILRAPDYWSFLERIALKPLPPGFDIESLLVNTESLLELLRQQVRVKLWVHAVT